jgi:hypothetical protein
MDFIAYADTSIPAIYALRSPINAEAQIAKIPPCALAAIVDNESVGENVLQNGVNTATMLLPDGTRPGVGVCQITAGVDWSDYARPTFQGYDLWNVPDNLYCAAAFFLAPAIQSALRLQRDDPTGFARFGDGQVLFYAFAGYNEGWGTVAARYAAGENPDDSTTDGYAARATAAYNDFVAGSHRSLVGL